MQKASACMLILSQIGIAACGIDDGKSDTYVTNNHYHPPAPTSTAPPTATQKPTPGGTTSVAPSGNTPTTTGGGSPTASPTAVITTAPFRALSCNELEFATVYNQSSLCGEVLGTLPDINWFFGSYITDDDKDGYLEKRFPNGLAPKEYAVTVIDRECGGERSQFANLDYWNIGSCGNIAKMAPADKAFLYCDWYDAATNTTLFAPDASPSCEVRFAAVGTGTSCRIEPRGNMHNYTGINCQGLK